MVSRPELTMTWEVKSAVAPHFVAPGRYAANAPLLPIFTSQKALACPNRKWRYKPAPTTHERVRNSRRRRGLRKTLHGTGQRDDRHDGHSPHESQSHRDLRVGERV